jgi:tetratricopeptide (TPR) repeat protein
MQRWRPDAQRALRAATLALDGGDAESALQLAQHAAERLDARDGPAAVLPIRLRAYALQGKGPAARDAYAAVESRLNETDRGAMQRLLAWAWVRSGGIAEARALLAGATPNPDDELTGWLALYDGNLVGARRGLRRIDPRAADAVFALAFLSRTRAEQAPIAGGAFLALVRRDSTAAATGFVSAAAEVPDAASVLLLAAARVHQRQKRDREAVALWRDIVASHSTTPEAAEAELEWARSLRAHGDAAQAITRLEHLILTWPESALLPQARHELDQARAAIRRDVDG